MTKKYSTKARILAAITVMILSSIPTASQASFAELTDDASSNLTSAQYYPLFKSSFFYARDTFSQFRLAENDAVTENTTDTASDQSSTLTVMVEKPGKKPVLTMEGQASYYSWKGCLGCNPLRVMANGQVLDDNALTMAIGADKKHLVGRIAKITNLVSGKSVVARITDTGGFYQARYGHRVADLTPATKQAIGMEGGLAHVRVEVF